MEQDYYNILGVPAYADIQTIKAAYRKRAIECHPDRGGSHEKMILVNEAYQILSNPTTRSHYDYACRYQTNLTAQRTASEEAENAKRQAQEYPRNWADFQTWLDSIIKDFSEAKYDSSDGIGIFSSYWPTVKGSFSGWLFIIAGGIAGLLVITSISASLGVRRIHPIFALVFACGGAWLGVLLHYNAGRLLKSSAGSRPSSTKQKPHSNADDILKRIISCIHCGQKLRVPERSYTIHVTCPTCSKDFSVDPQAESRQSKHVMPPFHVVWQRMRNHIGELFTGIDGQQFKYEVNQNNLSINNTNQTVSKSRFEEIYLSIPLQSKAPLQHQNIPLYTWSILMDPRIRENDW